MVAVISNYFSVHEKERRIGQNITFVSGDIEPDGSWFRNTKHALYRVAFPCIEQIFPTLFWFLCETETVL